MYRLINKVFAMSIAFALFALIACEQKQAESSIMKDTLTKNNMIEVAKKIADDPNFNKDDIEFLTVGMERLMNVDSLEGKTVGQVIESQKELIRYASVQNLKNSAARQQMNCNAKIDFRQKLKLENDSINVDGVEFIIKNKSGKSITGIAGRIRFINQQNQIVKIVDVKYENLELAAGTDLDKKDFWIHDSKNQFDIAFRTSEHLTATWLPEKITFSDGTIISSKEEDNKAPAEDKKGESK